MFIVIAFIFLGIGLGYTVRTRLAAQAGAKAVGIWTARATTMDTTLPIITQTIGQRYVALSIFHGFATDFTVPFLVTMWCMLGA